MPLNIAEPGKVYKIWRIGGLKRTQHSIVCEGVETREVADFLIQEECDQLQGYFYYKPMEEAKFEALIQE